MLITDEPASPEYTRIVDELFAHADSAAMTEADWLDVALAALDQAGLSARDQRCIATILRASNLTHEQKLAIGEARVVLP